MNNLIPINYDNPERPTVSGRELHEFLGVKSRYNDWFNNMTAYGFAENVDYVSLTKNLVNGGRSTDHQLTIPMAKELCMIQRNERGKQARQYFLAIEAQWNSPEAVMRRAVLIADRKVKELQSVNRSLLAENNDLKPDAEYARAVCVGKNCRTTTSLAKDYGLSAEKLNRHPSRPEDPVQDQRRAVGVIRKVLRQGLHQKPQIHAVPAQEHRRVGHQEHHRLDGSGTALYL